MLGISRQRINKIAQTDATFPTPEAELIGGRIWRRDAIEAWARQTGRLPAEEQKRPNRRRR